MKNTHLYKPDSVHKSSPSEKVPERGRFFLKKKTKKERLCGVTSKQLP